MKILSAVASHLRLGRVSLLGIALFLGLTAAASAAIKKPLPAGAVDTGALPASTSVHATIYLQPDALRVAALTQFLADVQTPSSASYHQWVTPAQFATRFGATEAQIARVSAFARTSGLSILSTSGLRLAVTGTNAQIEAAFAPGLHQVSMAGKLLVASTTVATVPSTLRGDVALVSGMETTPETSALTFAGDGTAITSGGFGSLDDLATAVESNTVRVLAISGTACAGDFLEGARTATSLMLREAAAQGITVLAQSACTTSADTSFPAALPDVVAAVSSSGVSGDLGFLADTPRPLWQSAPGLPADTLRHEPDLAVSSLANLASTFAGILAKMDAAATTPTRLGNVAQTLYELAPMKGLYTQPDATSTGLVGNWESTDGLGLVDLDKLAQWFPRGTLSTYITVSTTPSYVTHGTTITFAAEVKDTSGQGTSVPTGTVTFATSAGLALGSATLTPDSVGANASVTSNQVPAGGYNVIATYSGDSQYASNTNQTYFTVGPEEGTLSAVVAGAVPLGGTIQVTISDKSTSGVGTPNVTGTVIPQGISNSKTYSVALTGSNGTSSGSVSIPASVAGSITLLVGCTSTDPNFTCYNSINATATVNKATPTMTLTSQPNPVVANQPVVFTAIVTGGTGLIAPTGTVIFYDNGVNIGQGGVDNTTGKATATVNGLSAGTAHSFTATYYGDNNYVGAGATANSNSGTYASSTTLAVSPNPPVSGSTTTLTATVVSGTTSSTAVPTGTVTFYQDAVALSPTATVNASGVATFTSTALSGSTAHTYYAVYSGDTTYQTSQSANVATAATGAIASATTLSISPNPPVSGSTTTLTATVVSGSTSSTAIPTGTVTFYQDGAALTPTATVNASGVATFTSTALSSTTAHTYYASYGGNTTYAPSASASVATPAAASGSTSTTLTVSPNPPVSGALTTLTATIAFTANGTAVPTGTVTFYQDGVALTPAASVVSGTTATYTSTTLSSTTAHTYTAKYSGDTKYTTSTSAAVATAAATTGSTATTLAVAPNPPVLGATTTLTATIAYTANGTAVPTGTVTFYDNGTALTPAATVVGGTTATYSSTILSGTTAHSFTAKYSGDTNYTTSTSAAVATSASTGTAASTITIAASPTTVAAGGTTTLTATVTSASSGTTTVPTGLVQFTSTLQGLLGTATLNASGVATLSPILSTAGVGTITATYVGDTTYAASTTVTGVAVTVTGTTISPTITLTISPTTVTYGGTVTFTTTVTGTPTTGSTLAGAITWTVTPNAGGTATTYTQALTATSSTTATASATITAPAVGTYTVTATCAGTNFSCSTLTISKGLAVIKTGTTVSLTASPSPPVSGSPELLTAYIAGPSNAALSAVCTGTVTFYVNGASAGSASVSGNQAVLVVTLPLPTKNVIYAIYTGDTNCSASTSNTLTLTQPPAATTATLTSNNSTALYTASVTLNMVVSAVPTATNTNPGYPTGSVTFYDTYNGLQSTLGTAQLIQNGPYSSLASFTTTGLLAGTHNIIGIYAGATFFSSSTTDSLVVNITDFTTTFSPSSSTTTQGQTVTALATVVPVNGFSGQVVLGCVPPSGSATTCSFSPAVLSGGGISTLTITTTKATASLHWPPAAGGVSFALTLFGLLWPARRRKLPLGLAVVLSLGLFGAVGCTTVRSDGLATQGGSGSGSSSGGTPTGTLQFSVTASGTDGRTVNRHDLKYFVTVQ